MKANWQKIIAGITAALAVIAVSLSAALAADVGSLREGLHREQRQAAKDRAQITALDRQVRRDANSVTCSDLRNLYMSGTDQFGNSVYVSAGDSTLPAHCITGNPGGGGG